MSKVLVIRFSSLGDVVQTFPAVACLAQAPQAEIHYITKEAFAPIVGLRPELQKVHTISNHASFRELRARVRELSNENFDFVLDLHNNLRSRVVCWILGRPFQRVRKYRIREALLYFFHRGFFRRFGFQPLERVQESKRVAELAVGHFAKVQTVAAPRAIASVFAELPMLPQAVVEAMRSHRLVCICAESAWTAKEWNAERFLELARSLEQSKTVVAWVGLRKPPQSSSPVGFDLTNALSLPALAHVFSRSQLLVCNDSGLMHLAESVGTPVVAVFGPTSRELGFAPRLPESKIAEVDLWCRPCSKTGRWCQRPVQRWKCLNDLSVDAVHQKVNEVLMARETAL